MVEPGEEPFAAAIREVREETLIEDLEFAWGEIYTQTNPTAAARSPAITSPRPATVEVSLPVIEALGRAEHNEFRWVDSGRKRCDWFRLGSPPSSSGRTATSSRARARWISARLLDR